MNLEILPQIKSRGNTRLLEVPLTALFCPQRCPRDLILKTYDLARAMRDAGVLVTGGFQTLMEKGVPAPTAARQSAGGRMPGTGH